jgi:hypothetical protein
MSRAHHHLGPAHSEDRFLLRDILQAFQEPARLAALGIPNSADEVRRRTVELLRLKGEAVFRQHGVERADVYQIADAFDRGDRCGIAQGVRVLAKREYERLLNVADAIERGEEP